MRKKLERKGKNFLIKVLKLFLRNKPVKGEIKFSSIKRILVIRQDNRIGNLILTTPLLLALREKFPGVKISYLVSEASVELFSNSRLMDELMVLEKKRYIRNPLAFVHTIIRLRRRKIDLAFDCSDESELSLSHGMWIYLSGARYRIGYKRESSDLFLNVEIPQAKKNRHAINMHLDLLRAISPLKSVPLPFLEVNKEEEVNIDFYLEKMGIIKGDFLIGINLGGTGRKRWAAENFIDLGDELRKKANAKLIYIWGPNERNLVENLRIPGLLKEVLPLPRLSALLKRCDLFISSDSGIMHLSTAVRTPTLAIFFNSEPRKYGPTGKLDSIIYSPDGMVELKEVLKKAEDMIDVLSKNRQVKVNTPE
ncbi:MAG: glycosyltransferase family 9 protein [candidate division Zixibacteria bacterium]|nr:glycosyltransferase family 9 protein [candidate division Zixibacteria bacterium]